MSVVPGKSLISQKAELHYDLHIAFQRNSDLVTWNSAHIHIIDTEISVWAFVIFLSPSLLAGAAELWYRSNAC